MSVSSLKGFAYLMPIDAWDVKMQLVEIVCFFMLRGDDLDYQSDNFLILRRVR